MEKRVDEAFDWQNTSEKSGFNFLTTFLQSGNFYFKFIICFFVVLISF